MTIGIINLVDLILSFVVIIVEIVPKVVLFTGIVENYKQVVMIVVVIKVITSVVSIAAIIVFTANVAFTRTDNGFTNCFSIHDTTRS
jgi:hypothetical protein